MRREAWETDREFLERRLVDIKKNSGGGWVMVVIFVGFGLAARWVSPHARFPAGGMYPMLIIAALIFAALGVFSHFHVKMLDRRLERMPLDAPETPEQRKQRMIPTREQLAKVIKTQNKAVLVGASVIVISIVAAIYQAVYHVPTYGWVVGNSFLCCPILLLMTVFSWSERRKSIRLYEDPERWAGNKFIETSEDRQGTRVAELAGVKRAMWACGVAIALLIGAAVYIKWFCPPQYASVFHGTYFSLALVSLFPAGLGILLYRLHGNLSKSAAILQGDVAGDAVQE